MSYDWIGPAIGAAGGLLTGLFNNQYQQNQQDQNFQNQLTLQGNQFASAQSIAAQQAAAQVAAAQIAAAPTLLDYYKQILAGSNAATTHQMGAMEDLINATQRPLLGR